MMTRRFFLISLCVLHSALCVSFAATENKPAGAIAPAIDPHRYTVEILYQVSSSLSSEDIRITTYDQTPAQFMVEGEAPTAGSAIDFGDRLKNNPELKDFKFDITPPTILPNEHAQFRIFGKL